MMMMKVTMMVWMVMVWMVKEMKVMMVKEDEGDDDGNYTRDGRSPPISKAITASNLFV